MLHRALVGVGYHSTHKLVSCSPINKKRDSKAIAHADGPSLHDETLCSQNLGSLVMRSMVSSLYTTASSRKWHKNRAGGFEPPTP